MEKKKILRQVVAAVVVLGAIAGYFAYRHQQAEAWRRGRGGAVPGVIPRVEPDHLTVDGQTGDWDDIYLYSLAGPGGEAAAPEPWEGVRMVHDGSRLYMLIALSGPVNETPAAGTGRGLLGQIAVDSDADPSTGESRPMDEEQVGVERNLAVALRTREGRRGVGYQVRAMGEEEVRMVEDGERNSFDHPEAIALSEDSVELAVPLRVLGLRLGRRATFVFQPVGGRYVRALTVRIK